MTATDRASCAPTPPRAFTKGPGGHGRAATTTTCGSRPRLHITKGQGPAGVGMIPKDISWPSPYILSGRLTSVQCRSTPALTRSGFEYIEGFEKFRCKIGKRFEIWVMVVGRRGYGAQWDTKMSANGTPVPCLMCDQYTRAPTQHTQTAYSHLAIELDPWVPAHQKHPTDNRMPVKKTKLILCYEC